MPQIARLGLLRTFQQTRIYGRMSCVDNMLISVPYRKQRFIDLFGRHDAEDRERAEQLLDFVGLYEKRSCWAAICSFGQQKLLEFGMALMNEPTVLMLDEPTAGINPTLINGLIDRLKRANQELGITLFVIEHNMRVIMNLAERIYCLAHGQMLAEGSPERDPERPARHRRLSGGALMAERRDRRRDRGEDRWRARAAITWAASTSCISVDAVAREAARIAAEAPTVGGAARAGRRRAVPGDHASCAPAMARWRSCTTSASPSARARASA